MGDVIKFPLDRLKSGVASTPASTPDEEGSRREGIEDTFGPDDLRSVAPPSPSPSPSGMISFPPVELTDEETAYLNLRFEEEDRQEESEEPWTGAWPFP